MHPQRWGGSQGEMRSNAAAVASAASRRAGDGRPQARRHGNARTQGNREQKAPAPEEFTLFQKLYLKAIVLAIASTEGGALIIYQRTPNLPNELLISIDYPG
jgi:hypothetical protein